MIIADTKFVINSSRERIWECLIMALMRCIPFERMEFADERSFSALLKIRIGFIALPMQVKMDIVDIIEPETIVTTLKARGMRGMVWLNQKATFKLTAIDKAKTEVAGKLVAEGMATILRIFLLWRVKSFASDSLVSVKGLLKEWTEHQAV